MTTNNKPQPENEIYSRPEFDELPIGKESLDPRLREVLLEFLLGGDQLPAEIQSVLMVTMMGMPERMNIQFHEAQVQSLEEFRSSQAEKVNFLINLSTNPHRLLFARAALACLYEQRQDVQTPAWAEAQNGKAFQDEINRRNRAVIEAFIEIYEYAFQQCMGKLTNYVRKPIDLSSRPVEFPVQEYEMDPEVTAVMRMTQLRNLAVIGAMMADGHKVQPSNLGQGNSFVLAPKDGLEGLPQMPRIQDEIDFRNTIRTAAHGLRTEGHFLITPILSSLLFQSLERKFPKNNPMHGLSTSIGMISNAPAMIIPKEEGILIQAISGKELRKVVSSNVPKPDVD